MNVSLPSCTFDFESPTSTHGGVTCSLSNLCYKVTNGLKMLLYGCLESIFFNLPMCRLVFLGLNFLIEYLNKIALLYNT